MVNSMNSKQVIAGISAAVLLVILVYPALSTGTVSISVKSAKIANADHVYVIVREMWVHQTGQSQTQGWRLLSNTSKSVDIVALQPATVLVTVQVPVGSYDSIRVNLSNVTLIYGSTTNRLQLESGQLSTNINFMVQAGKSQPLIMMISGHQEFLQGQMFFSAVLNVTLSGS